MNISAWCTLHIIHMHHMSTAVNLTCRLHIWKWRKKDVGLFRVCKTDYGILYGITLCHVDELAQFTAELSAQRAGPWQPFCSILSAICCSVFGLSSLLHLALVFLL